VLLIIATARLVTDYVHTFGEKSLLLFITSQRILIKAFILHLVFNSVILNFEANETLHHQWQNISVKTLHIV